MVALLLGFLTTRATQWQMLAGNLPRKPDFAALRFAPSGNEWQLKHFHTFGADRYDLRRTATFNLDADPADDARAVIGRGTFAPGAIPLASGKTAYRVIAWGWPMRHTAFEGARRRHYPLGFAVDSLAYAPIWLLILHLIRAPIAAIARRFRPPPYACNHCRYDLRGLPHNAPCPECGRLPT